MSRRRRLALGALVALSALAAFLFALRTPDIDRATAEARYRLAASQFIETPSAGRLHVTDSGPRDPARTGGQTLVLLHGSTASVYSWQPWIDRLSARHRLVAIDLPGHGLTGPHPSDCYTIACMVTAVEEVRRALGLGPGVLAGHSMGGAVAVGHALARPGEARGLILVAAGGAPVEPSGSPIGLRLAAQPAARPFLERYSPRWLVERSLRDSATVDDEVATRDNATRYWELLRREGNRRATALRMAQVRRPFDERQLRALASVPVLLIWGEDDRQTPPAAGQWYAAQFPGSRLEIFPATGHLPHEERADATAAIVAQWLQTLPPAPPVSPASQPAR